MTETWLTSLVDDSILGLPDDYIIFRRDRGHEQRGGGVLVGIHASLSPVRLTALDPENIELMWFSIKSSRETWIAGLMYRQPSSNVSFWEHFQQNLSSIEFEHYNGCLLLGDFNVDMSPQVPNSATRNRMLDVTNEFGLYQMVTNVTRPSLETADQGSIIDLVFTNRPDWISA